MTVTPDWRELLGAIISNPLERDRIAGEIGVHPVTLSRWVSGDSSPRTHNLRQLLRTLSKPQRAQLLPALERLFPDLADMELEGPIHEIPYKFIMDVFEERASSPDLLRFWGITEKVLPQALKQLDPDSLGMLISVVRCMPPTCDGKIHSLREVLVQGTPPWGTELAEKALFLGAESLAGHATVSCRPAHIEDLRHEKIFVPAYQTEHEISAVASPILFANRVAGCLLFSSTQPNYFLLEGRLSLVQDYTNIMALAFDPEDFYMPEMIDLYVMPAPEVQQRHLATFRQRVMKILQEVPPTGQRLTNTQAEQLAWRQVEELLLNLSC